MYKYYLKMGEVDYSVLLFVLKILVCKVNTSLICQIVSELQIYKVE